MRTLLAAAAIPLVSAGCEAPPQPRALIPEFESARAPARRADVDDVSLGLALLRARRDAAAESVFTRSLVVDGPSTEALVGSAVANIRLGRLARAEDMLRAAVDYDPNSAIARNNLGVVLFETGRLREAETEFERAFAITGGADPQVVRSLEMTQLALEELGDPVPGPEPEWTLVRLGHGRYRLEPAAIVGPPAAEEPS